MVTDLDQNSFIKRLVELRQNKGISARDMSLSIGQSAGYINNIENGINYPSMTVFFTSAIFSALRLKNSLTQKYPIHWDIKNC